MLIGNNTVVSLRYIMKNEAGEILEDIIEGTAIEYLHGSGNILPQLETNLAGLKAGDKRCLSFVAESNLRHAGETFHFYVIIDNVRMTTEQEVLTGKPQPSRADSTCGPDCRC